MNEGMLGKVIAVVIAIAVVLGLVVRVPRGGHHPAGLRSAARGPRTCSPDSGSRSPATPPPTSHRRGARCRCARSGSPTSSPCCSSPASRSGALRRVPPISAVRPVVHRRPADPTRVRRQHPRSATHLSAKAVLRRAGQLRPDVDAARSRPTSAGGSDARAGMDVYVSIEDSVALEGPPRSGKGYRVLISAILDWSGPLITTSTTNDNLTATMRMRQTPRRRARVRPAGTVRCAASAARLARSPGARIRSSRCSAAPRSSPAPRSALPRRTESGRRHPASSSAGSCTPPPSATARSPTSTTGAPAPRRAQRRRHPPRRRRARLGRQPRGDDRRRRQARLVDLVRRPGRRRTARRPADPRRAACRARATACSTRASSSTPPTPCIWSARRRAHRRWADSSARCSTTSSRSPAPRALASPGSRLAHPLGLILDEIANMFRWGNLPRIMADGGGRGICTFVVLQALSQAETSWSRAEADTIWAAATAKVLLGGASHVEPPSRRRGAARHAARPAARSARGRHARPATPPASSTNVCPLMSVDEIRRMPQTVGLLAYRNRRGVLLDLAGWDERRDARDIQTGKRETEQRAARRVRRARPRTAQPVRTEPADAEAVSDE